MQILNQTSTISHGNMSLRFGNTDTVIQNRKNFLQENGVEWNNHICMRCNHKEQIIVVNYDNQTDESRMIEAEVLVTQEKDLTLMLLTADCLPTTLYDPVTHTLALAHFSRETITEMLPQKTVRYMREHFEVDPKNLQVTVGPHIHKKSYRFPSPLQTVSNTLKPYITVEPDYTYIGLPSAHNAQLTAMGVQEKNIIYSNVDTVTSNEHFSHYQNKKENTPQGRIATIAMISS